MSVPPRANLALANNNEEIAYVLSGATAFQVTSEFNGFRNVTVTGGDITNYGAVGVEIVFDSTLSGGFDSPSLQLSVDSKDEAASGKYVNIVSGTAIDVDTGNTVQVIRIHPSFAVSGGTVKYETAEPVDTIYAAGFLPRTWRIRVSHLSGAASCWAKYTVGINPILR